MAKNTELCPCSTIKYLCDVLQDLISQIESCDGTAQLNIDAAQKALIQHVSQSVNLTPKESTVTKPERFRKAVLGLTCIDSEVPMLTIEDVTRKWSFLGGGYSPYKLMQIGNGDDIDDELFEELMKRLNSRL